MKINKRKTILIIISVLTVILISIVSVSCMGMGLFSGSTEETADQGVEVFEVQRSNIYQTVSTTGTIDSEVQNTYTLQVTGEVLSTLEKGDTFRKGNILVEVDKSDGLLSLEQIESDIESAESSLRTAKINYQKALDANHITIQLASLNTEKAEKSTESALNSLENANKSAELSYESASAALKNTTNTASWTITSAKSALDEAERILEEAKNDSATTASQLAKYEYNVKSAEEKYELTKVQQQASIDSSNRTIESTEYQNRSSTDSAQSSYNQSLLNQSTTYWNDLSSLQSAEVQIELVKENIGQAEMKLELAKMDFESAKKDLDDYILYAPYNGIVVSSDFEVGNQNGGNTISIISNNFLIDATIGETDISKVSASDEVYITLDAYPDNQFSGEVEKIIPIAVEEGNIVSFEIIIKFSDAEDTKMYYGLSASVDIVTEKAEDVLYVPIQAVYTENGKSYVDLLVSGQVDSENMEQAVNKVEVTTGINDYSYIEITSGLKEGDIIVTSRI
jgi:HlyD family secretion protein